MALQFSAQTVLGAAKTVLQTGKHPAILRDEVSFPLNVHSHHPDLRFVFL